MKIQVRRNLFETNSSSVHTITMCMDSDYEKWKSGEYVFNKFDEKLIPVKDKKYQEWSKLSDEEKENEYIQYDYLTYDQFFNDYEAIEYETFSEMFKTTNGEIVHAFGYYGHD